MSKWFYIIRKGTIDRIEHKQKDALAEAEIWQADKVTRICSKCSGKGYFYFAHANMTVNCPSCHNHGQKIIWENDHV